MMSEPATTVKLLSSTPFFEAAKDTLIEVVKGRFEQQVSLTELFALRWEVV